MENPSKYTQRGKLRSPTQGRFTPGTKLPYRKGPIPQKILDLLIGTLLGDAYGEKLKNGVTPNFQFKQSFIHVNYLYYLYFTLAFWGYTSANAPLPKTTSDGKGGLHTYLSFRTLAIAPH